MLYTIDRATGVVTFVGGITGGSDIRGIESMPGDARAFGHRPRGADG